MRSEDAFRPPPGLVSLSAGVFDGEAPLNISGVGGQSIVEDHMRVSLIHSPLKESLIYRDVDLFTYFEKNPLGSTFSSSFPS